MEGSIVCFFLLLTLLLDTCNGTHVFKIDRDFGKVNSDPEVAKHAGEVVRKLRTFKVAVHPRVRLLYRLLKRAMARHAHRVASSLYAPHAYRPQASSEA